MAADVTTEQDTARFLAAAAAMGGGRIDALFNNAGVEGRIRPIQDVSVDDFDPVGMTRTWPSNSRGWVSASTRCCPALSRVGG
jgi:NAD(P)-dependent dehydrogenase (short-subunit alcohol dehydrogenase family)